MGYIEAKHAVIYGRVVEDVRIPYVRDEYYETVIVPGFSDGHAHPQVVDAGVEPGRVWANSYQWIEGRRLLVDEASLRSDLELSSRLAELLYKRALLEGTTLIAVTGRLEANVSAWLRLPVKPRVVLLPTVMYRRGWARVEDIAPAINRLRNTVRDGLARLGVFVHSLRYSSPGMIIKALRLARSMRSVLGMHLSEGVSELGELLRVVGRPPYGARIVGVHCIEDEDFRDAGIPCISCPATNLILYSRTRRSLKGVVGFGSDWPLLLGTVAKHIGVILGVFNKSIYGVLKRATIGGYRAYGMNYIGDIAAYDEGLNMVLEGRATPRLVTVSWKPAVVEGELAWSGEDGNDVSREIREAVREAVERHGKDTAGSSRLAGQHMQVDDLLALLRGLHIPTMTRQGSS